jgi:hypothetical protein
MAAFSNDRVLHDLMIDGIVTIQLGNGVCIGSIESPYPLFNNLSWRHWSFSTDLWARACPRRYPVNARCVTSQMLPRDVRSDRGLCEDERCMHRDSLSAILVTSTRPSPLTNAPSTQEGGDLLELPDLILQRVRTIRCVYRK